MSQAHGGEEHGATFQRRWVASAIPLTRFFRFPSLALLQVVLFCL